MPYIDGVFTEANNDDRADWASLALAAHYKATHPSGEEFPESGEDEEDREEMQTALQDLLTDLRHFAWQAGIDYLQAEENASANYCEELEEEGMEVDS